MFTKRLIVFAILLTLVSLLATQCAPAPAPAPAPTQAPPCY